MNTLPVKRRPLSMRIVAMRPAAFSTPPGPRSRRSPYTTSTPASSSQSRYTRSATCGSNVHISGSGAAPFLRCLSKSSRRSRVQAESLA